MLVLKEPSLAHFWLVSGGGVRPDPVSAQGTDPCLEMVSQGA